MLQNESMSYLEKHSWLSYLNQGNKSQKISRITRDSNKAFTALALLAQKLPDDIFRDIFNRNNISMLLNSMQTFKEGKNKEWDRTPDLRIADYLVQYGLDIMITEYKKLSWYTPEIAQLTLDHLSKTKAICHDISLNAETTNLEDEAKHRNLRYLFSLERINNEDRQRFEDYIFEIISNGNVQKMTIIKRQWHVMYFSKSIGGLEALVTPLVENPDVDLPIEGNIDLDLDIPNLTAKIKIYCRGEKFEKKLSMDYRNNDYYFYDKSK